MATARAKFVFQAVDQTKAAVQSVRRNVTGVRKGFDDVRKSANKTSRDIQKQFRAAEVSLNRLGKSATNAGRSLSLRLTAPVAAAGVGILKVAGDFEAAMNRVQVKTGATGDSFTALREQAKQLGASTQFSARQAAEGQEILATAGFKANQILKALPGTLDLAAAGQLELGDAARYVSAGVNQFNLDASESGRVADILAKGSLLADQTVGDLGEALSKSASTAKSFGIGIEETGAALSVLAQQGRRAEEGGTAFRNFLAEVQSPANKARQRVEELGFSLNNADGSLKSVAEILAIFNAAGINAGNSAQYFQKRVGDTYRILDAGQASLVSWSEELRNAGGTAAEVAAANLKGFRGELTKLRSALEGLAIAIADSGLLEWATQLVAKLGGVVSRLTETNPALLRTATLVAGVAAAIGPALLALGALASSLGALAGLPATFAGITAAAGGLAAVLTGPVVLGVGAVIAVVVALVDAWRSGAEWIRTVGDLFNTVASDLSATLAPALEVVARIFNQALLPALKTIGQALITGLAVAFRIVSTVIRVTLGPLLEALAKWIGEVLPSVIDVAKRAWDGFVRFTREAAAKLLETLANMLGFLAKLPGVLGDAFADGAAKLQEFATAVGDLEKPLATAVQEVSSFGASVTAVQDAAEDTTPWDRLIEKLQEITGAAREAKGATEDAAGADSGKGSGGPAPTAGEGTEDPITEKPKAALLNLKRVGETVATSLETNLAGAITNLSNPIRAVADTFKSLFSAVIAEIAGQIASKLVAQLLGLFAGGPLGFLAGGAAGGGPSLAAGGAPALATTGPGSTPAPGTVNVYQSIIPATTSDRARAGRGVRVVDRQAARFVLGAAVG